MSANAIVQYEFGLINDADNDSINSHYPTQNIISNRKNSESIKVLQFIWKLN